WGRPRSKVFLAKWPAYASAPWSGYRRVIPDLVLVDGRFRVACIALAVLNSRSDTVIAVHDFWDRPWYHVCLPLLEIIAREGRLGVFNPREPISREEAMRIYKRFRFNPS